MTDEEFKEHKYHEYKPSAWYNNECIVKCFQKAFRDNDDNRKYFLTWEKWDFSQYARGREDLQQPSYQGSTQLQVKKNNQYINIEFLSGWDLTDAEDFMKALFDTGCFKKYDDRDNEDEDVS